MRFQQTERKVEATHDQRHSLESLGKPGRVLSPIPVSTSPLALDAPSVLYALVRESYASGSSEYRAEEDAEGNDMREGARGYLPCF